MKPTAMGDYLVVLPSVGDSDWLLYGLSSSLRWKWASRFATKKDACDERRRMRDHHKRLAEGLAKRKAVPHA